MDLFGVSLTDEQTYSMLPSTIDEAATGLESITCHLSAVVAAERQLTERKSPYKIDQGGATVRHGRSPDWCLMNVKLVDFRYIASQIRNSLDVADGMASGHHQPGRNASLISFGLSPSLTI